MQHSDLLRAISSHCRRNPTTALFVVGWFAAAEPQKVLEDLLEAIHESERVGLSDGHLAAYNERWGQKPADPS
jgi:hypothetical protein